MRLQTTFVGFDVQDKALVGIAGRHFGDISGNARSYGRESQRSRNCRSMTPLLYLPADEFADTELPNWDLAADYLELSAIFSKDCQSLSEDIVSALEIAAEQDYSDVEGGN